MKLKENVDITQFIIQIRKCSADVFFETPEGDCLSLKSALSQYIFCSVLNRPELLQNGRLRFAEESDRVLLRPYLDGE